MKSVNIFQHQQFIRIEFWDTDRLINTIDTIKLTLVELKKINDFMGIAWTPANQEQAEGRMNRSKK